VRSSQETMSEEQGDELSSIVTLPSGNPARETPSALPTCTVTFLFTDIESSTSLWKYDLQAMQRAFPRQETIVREAMSAYGEYVCKMIGDALQGALRRIYGRVGANRHAQGAYGPSRRCDRGAQKVKRLLFDTLRALGHVPGSGPASAVGHPAAPSDASLLALGLAALRHFDQTLERVRRTDAYQRESLEIAQELPDSQERAFIRQNNTPLIHLSDAASTVFMICYSHKRTCLPRTRSQRRRPARGSGNPLQRLPDGTQKIQ
jgi:class 3 adenylate cyclase